MKRGVVSETVAEPAATGPAPGPGSLQHQIRRKVIEDIASGVYPAGLRLPSSRKLALALGVARNTVVAAYQQLVSEGYLIARERSGIYVGAEVVRRRSGLDRVGGPSEPPRASGWTRRLARHLPEREGWRHPPDWQKYPYPFIEGHFDHSLFPVAEWREATRLALGVREIEAWTSDMGDADDPLLIEQIRTKILPRRGIGARPEEILVTLGTQQALSLILELFAERAAPVALEEPGPIAIRDLLSARRMQMVHQPVDENGMLIDDRLDRCGLVHVTPSHQRPTAATLSAARRRALLEKAQDRDFFILEDDFECETNYLDEAVPALRGMPGGDRVIYFASLSRVLSPGLRLGFLVAQPEVVAEARRLRGLVSSNPPLNNQRTAALFLSLGHYDTTVRRLGRVFRERLIALRDALNHYRPQSLAIAPVRGGTTYWVHGPEGLDASELARRAESRGVLIEPAGRYYAGGNGPANVFRMGITGITAERVRAGVAVLAEVIREMAAGEIPRLDVRHAKLLKGAALKRRLAGATLLYKTVYGDPCTIELLEDGRMEGRSGYANEDTDSGRWWIEGDFWCRQWNSWAYAESASFLTALEGDQIRWLDGTGRLMDSAIYISPQKKRNQFSRLTEIGKPV